MNSLSADMIRVTPQDGDKWEARVVSDEIPKLRGERPPRVIVHADGEESARKAAFEQFAPKYPFMLLTGVYKPVEVAIACIRELGSQGRWKGVGTEREYTALVRNHSGKLSDRKRIDEITKTELQKVCFDLCNSGLSVATVRKFRAAWSCVFEYLIKQGLMQANPAHRLELPKFSRPVKRMLTEAEYGALCNALDAALADGSTDKDAINRRNALFGVYVGLFTGMRAGEVCGLQRGDVHFTEQTLRIERSITEDGGLHATAPKTDSSIRTIGMSEGLADAMRAHFEWQARYMSDAQRRADDTPICCRANGKPFPPKALSKAFKDFCKDEAGVKLKRGESFHILRHTHASMLIASGLDVKTISARLGHSSTTVTLDVYGHLMTGSENLVAATFQEQHGKMRKAGEFR